MDRISDETIRALVQTRDSKGCVSIYLPTHRAGRDIAQDPIRLKNLLRQAEAQLKERDNDAAMLNAAKGLLEDSVFWRYQGDGLAIFCNSERSEAFRLPMAFPEMAKVNDRFYVKPLLAYLNQDAPFYVLALSQKQVRFYEGNRAGIHPIECPGLPKSMAEVVPADEPHVEVQWHTVGTGAMEGTNALFHGQGGVEKTMDEKLLQFVRQCESAVTARLRESQAPLILACVEKLAPYYRQVNTYEHLEDEFISGSPGELTEKDLFEGAWPMIERKEQQRLESTAERYRAGKPHGRASNKASDVLEAARAGRVESVLIAADSADEDLVEAIATETYLTRGQVIPVPKDRLPDRGLVAAVFRY